MSPVNEVVAVFAPLYPPAFHGGGPIRSIEALVSTVPAGVDPVVLTSDRDLGADSPLAVTTNSWLPLPVGCVYYASLGSPWRLWRALNAVRRIRPTILHFNSFMNPRLTITPLLLWRIRFFGSAQILIAPRGEFGDSALQSRSLKKRAYITVFRLLRINRATIWHSTASHETQDIRKLWGESASIIERGNDTLLASTARLPQVGTGPLRAAFLGRIVKHKGLAVALTALSAVTEPVQLDVYGSREDEAYAAHCEALAANLPANIGVRFHGAVEPDTVIDRLEEHDVLFMPTAGENFGHVIAEALAASCFVLATAHTPWTDWLVAGGGVVLDRSPVAWTEAIQRLAGECMEERVARRIAAGRTYEAWVSRPREPHIWSLALERVHSGRGA